MNEIVLIGYGILATVIAGGLLFRARLTKGQSTESVHFSLERIRNVGELNVLTAYIKEVITMSSGEGSIFKSNGKILLICGFDIEFRYDLKKIKVSNPAGEKASILLPPHFIKVIPKETQFYDEQKAKLLGFISKDFTVEERNKLLHEAREKAIEQAGILQGELQEKVRASAKATLSALAEAFGTQGVTFAFEESTSVVQQLNDQLSKVAA